MLRLARINPHIRDKRIILDAKAHVYTVDGKQGYVSITTLVGRYFKPFEKEKTALRLVRKRTNSKYDHIDRSNEREAVSEILQMWEDAALLGTELHAYIEYEYNQAKPDALSPILDVERQRFHMFKRAYENLGYEPYRTEWLVFDEDLLIAGCVDMVFKHSLNQTYHIIDWKRTQQIRRQGYQGQMGYPPCHVLPDCNMSKYTLQLNFYKHILQKRYGIMIESMKLVVFHAKNNRGTLIYNIPDKQDLITAILEDE